MNFFDSLRIKRNPNVIDSFKPDKLDTGVIAYAIAHGYRFHPESMQKFVGFSQYLRTFSGEEPVLQYLKQLVIQSPEEANIRNLQKIYRDEFVSIVKADSELSKVLIENGLGKGLTITDAIQIADGKDELIEELTDELIEVVRNNITMLSSEERKKSAEYIAMSRNPQELTERGIDISNFADTYIRLEDPQKILELFNLLEEKDIWGYEAKFVQMIENNIGEFISYLSQLDSIYRAKTGRSIVDETIKSKTIEYLKAHHILYDKTMPEFVLEDDQYIVQCVLQDPTIIREFGDKTIEFTEEEANEIAQKISAEQIRFEDSIPFSYMLQKQIFEAIVSENPELAQDGKNTDCVWKYIQGMSHEEVIDYYRQMHIPFNVTTVGHDIDNILLIIECLKNDFMTLADTSKEFSREEYEAIYEAMQETIDPESILKSKFLTQNPYFVRDLLKSGADVSEINLRNTKYYEEFYLELKSVAVEQGISIPEPRDYQGIIHMDDQGEIYIYPDSLESVRKGLEYIEQQGSRQDLKVRLRQQDPNHEFMIFDNIEFFEELARKGININFEYDTAREPDKGFSKHETDRPRTFSLEEILEHEHLMQLIVDDIRSKDFSPLEQLIAVYDIAKTFKPYKFGPYVSQSRALHEYLGNDYMVCAGYANLIMNLGHRLNAPYSTISLKIHHGEQDGLIDALRNGHARNYVNIVDHKYGIDGYYVLEPTWEASGEKRDDIEARSSTYNEFLLTTDEGRRHNDGGILLKSGGSRYDDVFTPKSIADVRRTSREDYKLVRLLDPEFYRTICELDLSTEEGASTVFEYLQSKINQPVLPKTLLDAIMQVKRKLYKYSEQDFDDMRMEYAATSRFGYQLSRDEEWAWREKRYQDIKFDTVSEAERKNPCLDVSKVLGKKIVETRQDNQLLSAHRIRNEHYIELLKKHRDKIEEFGFGLSGDEEEGFILIWPEIPNKDELPIETIVREMERQKEDLYAALGLEKEQSREPELETGELVEDKRETCKEGKSGLEDCMEDDGLRSPAQQAATQAIRASLNNRSPNERGSKGG